MILENPWAVLTIVFVIASALIIIVLLLTSIRIVPMDKRLSISRLGREIGERGPGLVLLIPIVDRGLLVNPTLGTKPSRTAPSILGAIGTAVGPIEEDGTVEIDGLEWPAFSRNRIPDGARVRIKAVMLEVEVG
jgi:membrane-bound ClpP family serine protease